MTKRHFIWFSVIALTVATMLLIPRGLKHLQHSAYSASAESTAAAIASALHLEIRGRGPELHRIIGKIPTTAYVLSPTQYRRTIDYLDQQYELDATKGWRRGRMLLDPWGQPFSIEIIKDSGGRHIVGVRVFSVGRDGKQGTDDDIVS